MLDKLSDECGVAGVFGLEDASQQLYLALFALQHRGQEAAGIVTFDRTEKTLIEGTFAINLFVHKCFGLVSDGIQEQHLSKLKGRYGVGHVRYSTQGGAMLENIQPFQFKTSLGPVAIAHNGNLTNAREIRKGLESSGSVFQSTSDTEVFVHLIARSASQTMRERIGDAIRQVQGAYSLTILTSESLYAIRDPRGLRPLVIGTVYVKSHGVSGGGVGYVVVSETCALDLMGAEYLRDVEPGEVVQISDQGLTSWFPQNRKPLTFCSFEPIYFARPDSLLYGESIYLRRRRIGEVLAEECPAVGDVVIPIPDSGVAMAEGFASHANIPLAMGLVRNHYIGRTFIKPDQSQRDTGVRLKLNPVKSVLAGRKVIVVDDSLVRGTTAARILKLLKDAGAKEVHFRVGAPPITHSCFYGVDTPERRQLLAAQKTVGDIKKMLNADSLGFISPAGLRKALLDSPNRSFCMACFTGQYPEPTGTSISVEPTDQLGPGLFAD